MRVTNLRLAGVGLLLTSLAATGLMASGGGAQAAPDAAARTVVDAARREVGDAYQWGGNGPAAWDCSGLPTGMWRRAGITNMPRVSREQQRWAWPIKAADARPGDLVFFGEPVTHVGIYIGDGRMIDASSSRKQIVERAIWTSDVVRYGRVPRPGVARPAPPKPASSTTAKPSPAATSTGKPASPAPKASASPAPKSTGQPTTTPSSKPTQKPAGKPSAKPTQKPSTKPSTQPAPNQQQAQPHRPVPADGHRARTTPWADKVVATANRAVGSGWQEKGTGPSFDSAGLLRWAVRNVDGRSLPDTAAGIERLTTPVALSDLRVGDLVFYGKPAVHVGIYVGDGRMIDASKVLKKVTRRRVFSSETVRFGRLK